MDGSSTVNESPSYTDKQPIVLEELLNRLADEGAGWSDYPNDFETEIYLSYDEMTTIVVGLQLEEEPGVCDECRSHQDYTSPTLGYGCDHDEPDNYRVKRWVTVINTSELDRVNYEDGTVIDA